MWIPTITWMCGNNLIVGTRRCRRGYTTRPRIHSPPKGPTHKLTQPRKTTKTSNIILSIYNNNQFRKRGKESQKERTNQKFLIVPAVHNATCYERTYYNWRVVWKYSSVALVSLRKLRSWMAGGLLKSVTESSEKRNWLPCGGCNVGHLLRSRLDNGHTPTATTWGPRRARVRPSDEEIVSREAD